MLRTILATIISSILLVSVTSFANVPGEVDFSTGKGQLPILFVFYFTLFNPCE